MYIYIYIFIVKMQLFLPARVNASTQLGFVLTVWLL